VLVASVEDNTPAAKAGFQVEDVIVRFNNQPITSEGVFRDMVARTAPGTTVPVVVRRDGKDVTLTVTVGEPKDTPVAQRGGNSEEPSAQGKLGVSVADVTNADIRKQFNIKENVQRGAVIVEVAPGSPAAAAGLQPGDVLIRLNGKSIADAKELPEIVRGFKDGDTVTAVIRRGDQRVLAQIEME
jgi:serine protease Do